MNVFGTRSGRNSCQNRFVLNVMNMATMCLLLATAFGTFAQSAVRKACSVTQLNQVIQETNPGDTVEMCNGKWSNAVIRFYVQGTSDAPIRLVAESPGQVVLTGSSRLLLSGRHAVVDGLRFEGQYTGSEIAVVQFRSTTKEVCNDCRVTNLSIIDYNPSDRMKLTRWVVLHGKRNRIDHSHFRGKNNRGAMIQLLRGADPSPNYHRIDHNLLENRPELIGDGNLNGDTLEIGETGEFAYGMTESVIEFNYLRNIDSDYEVVTVKSSGNLLQYNVLDSSKGVFSLRQGSDNIVHGNYVLGRGKSGTGGIKIRGKNHIVTSNYISDVNPDSWAALAGLIVSDGTSEILDFGRVGSKPYYKFERADNVQVLHNTVVDSGLSVAFGTGSSLPPQNIELTNNVYVQNQGRVISNAGMGSNMNFSNNVFFGANLGIDAGGFQKTDPRLISDDVGIQRPSSQSPVINAAKTKSNATMDMDGQQRESLPDIGADEVISGQPFRGPVSICGVGPRTYRVGLPSACDNGVMDGRRPMPPALLSAE